MFVSHLLMFSHFIYKLDSIWAINYVQPISLHKIIITSQITHVMALSILMKIWM